MIVLTRRRYYSVFAVILLAACLMVVTGCDQSQELTGPYSEGGKSASAGLSTATTTAPATGSEISIGSLAELRDRLPEIGEPLAGSGKRIMLKETRALPDSKTGEISSNATARLVKGEPVMASSANGSKSFGPFKRQPRAYGVSGNVELPEPDAVTIVRSGADGNATSESISPNVICVEPGGPNCEDPPPPPPPCYPNCDDGGGGDNHPEFTGLAAWRQDSYLRLGQTTAETTTDIVGYNIVDEVKARQWVDYDINDGEYQHEGIPYTYTQPNADKASAITLRFNIIGDVDWVNDGEHWYNDGSYGSDHETSSLTNSTNYSASSCAPFPIWIQAGHEDGKTYDPGERIALEWQTICPQDNKDLKIRRTSGEGGSGASSWVETTGGGWGLKPFEAWHGLFLNSGDYQWRVRAHGESDYRTGTFSINSSGDLCRPNFEYVNRSISIGGGTTSTVNAVISGCTPPGTYRLVAKQDGRYSPLAGKTVDIEEDGPYAFVLSYRGGGADREYVELYRVSPYNGRALLDSNTYFTP